MSSSTSIIPRFAYVLLVSAFLNPAAAQGDCNSNFLPRVNRDQPWSLGADRAGAFADIRFEFQDWDTKDLSPESEPAPGPKDHPSDPPAAEDHGHNRSRDKYTHLTVGANWSDSLSFLVHNAFVEKTELTTTGSITTEGFGDTDLVGVWRFLRQDTRYVGGLLGVKLPTGNTARRDSEGRLIQPELQPGTGSFDAFIGPVFEAQSHPFIFRGNVLHFLRNGGSQDYTFGDSTSVSLFADYAVRQNRDWSLFVGTDTSLRVLGKDRQLGGVVRDSGGTLLLVGPTVTMRLGETALFSVSLLLPAVQDRGGEHQDLSRTVTIGSRWLF